MADVFMVEGLGCGDEGKGSIVDYLVRKYGARTVVRFNGGAQAAHNVVTPDGLHHTFAQFGSGTFVPEVKTHLSRFMLIDPLSMLKEEEHLQALGVHDAFQRTTIEQDVPIVTPFQRAVGRLFEIWRGEDRHGSCGMGIGQTMSDHIAYGDRVLFAKDLADPNAMKQKLRFIQEQACDKISEVLSAIPRTEAAGQELNLLESADAIDGLLGYYLHFSGLVTVVDRNHLPELLKLDDKVIFEGAQGVLLDRTYGFRPNVTKTDTTLANAYTLLAEAEHKGEVKRIGILRGYATRHGPGPLVSEDETLADLLPEPHNDYGIWQGAFRVGYFDLVATRYALEVIDYVDEIALTNLDRTAVLPETKVCTAYDIGGLRVERLAIPTSAKDLEGAKPIYEERQDFIKYLEESLGLPITIFSFGPTAQDKIPTINPMPNPA